MSRSRRFLAGDAAFFRSFLLVQNPKCVHEIFIEMIENGMDLSLSVLEDATLISLHP